MFSQCSVNYLYNFLVEGEGKAEEEPTVAPDNPSEPEDPSRYQKVAGDVGR